LSPQKTVEIPPGARYEFVLPNQHSQTVIEQVIRTKNEKIAAAPGPNQPTFNSGSALFNAIANGNRSDSWIEVDFNSFKCRRFFRGDVKKMFGLILSQIKPNAPS
jgi:hypothetical protein